jgi:hypothetical protein
MHNVLHIYAARRGKPSEGSGGALGGLSEGAVHHPMWVGLYIHGRQPNSLCMPKPNTI